jgi:hypothetical protein
MCATVCPSQALTFATAEEIQHTRRGVAINRWKFGNEEVTTKVFVIVPREVERVNVELVQISPTPFALPEDPYDVALMKFSPVIRLALTRLTIYSHIACLMHSKSRLNSTRFSSGRWYVGNESGLTLGSQFRVSGLVRDSQSNAG